MTAEREAEAAVQRALSEVEEMRAGHLQIVGGLQSRLERSAEAEARHKEDRDDHRGALERLEQELEQAVAVNTVSKDKIAALLVEKKALGKLGPATLTQHAYLNKETGKDPRPGENAQLASVV